MKTVENGWVNDGNVCFLFVKGKLRGSILAWSSFWRGNYVSRRGKTHPIDISFKSLSAAKSAVRRMVK